jgi:hypothetical protein
MNAATLMALRQQAHSLPHGSRARYVAGCHCAPCRAANTAYNTERAKARARGDYNGMVDASPVVEHLRSLSNDHNVGYKTAAEVANVSTTIVKQMLSGERRHCRALTAKRLLAVDSSCLADRALVDAGRAWKLLDELIRDGYTKTQLAEWLGSTANPPLLQLSRDRMTAKNALKVERLYKAIRAGRMRREK